MSAAHPKAPSSVPVYNVAPFYCGGKVQFASPHLAMAVAKRRRDINREHYRCTFCGLWHVGTIGVASNRSMRAELVRAE